jgi:hypothetical protein
MGIGASVAVAALVAFGARFVSAWALDAYLTAEVGHSSGAVAEYERVLARLQGAGLARLRMRRSRGQATGR